MRQLTNVCCKMAVGLLCAWFLLQPGQARAVGFDVTSLNGSFGFQINKFGTCQNIGSVVGVMQFDGSGNVSGSYKGYQSDHNGGGPRIVSETIVGTYKVHSDGTGKIFFSSPGNAKFAFVIDSTGTSAERMELVNLTTGSWSCVQSGYAIQQ